jgi:hypothetical protein
MTRKLGAFYRDFACAQKFKGSCNGSTFASPTKTYPTYKACKRAASKLLNSLLLLNDLY